MHTKRKRLRKVGSMRTLIARKENNDEGLHGLAPWAHRCTERRITLPGAAASHTAILFKHKKLGRPARLS